ncbi:glycoside hydrolase family 10 protein, partial [Candidatus Omnitrophota bacterium]
LCNTLDIFFPAYYNYIVMPKKNIFLIALIFLCFSATLCPGGISDVRTPRLGAWITVFSPERVLYSRENVDRLIRTCKESGIDDIYIQVYRADKAYYDSDITDRTAYENIMSESGEDTLKYLIDRSRAGNIKVYAWLNLLSIAQNKDANVIKKFGEGVLATDQHGRHSMKTGKKDELDKYYIRENQIFLEPGDPRVREYLGKITEEVVTKYPGLAGVHFDYIRYPTVVPFVPGSRFTPYGINYGYSAYNLKSFKGATGLDAKTMERSRENFRMWDDWRRDAVTSLVRELSERVRASSDSMEVSCTIVPSMERAYLVTFQDWTVWLRKGYADYVVAMNYTDDAKLMELNSGSLLLPDLDDKIHIGIGAYLLKERPDQIEAQLVLLRKLSPAGVVIFSYDDIAGNKELRGFLAENFKD